MNVSGERLLVSYTSGDLGVFDIETGKVHFSPVAKSSEEFCTYFHFLPANVTDQGDRISSNANNGASIFRFRDYMIKSQFVPREDILAILACIHIP